MTDGPLTLRGRSTRAAQTKKVVCNTGSIFSPRPSFPSLLCCIGTYILYYPKMTTTSTIFCEHYRPHFLFLALLTLGTFVERTCLCSWEEKLQNAYHAADLWRRVRDKFVQRFVLSDLASLRDALLSRLVGVTMFIGLDPEKSRLLVAFSVAEATWSSRKLKATREMQRSGSGVDSTIMGEQRSLK